MRASSRRICDATARRCCCRACARSTPRPSITTEVIGEVDGLEPATLNEARDIVMELTGANTAELVPFGTEAGLYQALWHLGGGLRAGLDRSGAQARRIRLARPVAVLHRHALALSATSSMPERRAARRRAIANRAMPSPCR